MADLLTLNSLGQDAQRHSLRALPPNCVLLTAGERGWPTERLPLGLGALQPSLRPLDQQIALELRYCVGWMMDRADIESWRFIEPRLIGPPA
jgi:hypothetical protein